MTTTAVPDRPPIEQLAFRDPARPLRTRVGDLLARLTPGERIAMLHQYSPAVPRLGTAAFRTGTEALHGVGWLGAATVFPQAVGLGATWDDELLHEVATAIGTELRAFHHHRAPLAGEGRISLQAWAPVVNLLRDPRWGRNEEGYAEDPLLTARLADSFCRGLAGDDPDHLRTAPILKHFLAYNNEDERCVTSSGLRPRVLHEYDLAAFRTAVASGSATGVMPAYNLVNGRPCHVSPLIEDELRRWAAPTGHELYVCSDAEAPSNLVDPEHYFEDHAESHAAALRAGVDSFTDHADDPRTTVARITEALARGLLTEADVDRAVRRQLSIRFRLGEFDPGPGPYGATPWSVVDSPAHRDLALRAATESVVLLRNERALLPLDPAEGRRVAVVGPLADTLFEDWYSGTMPYRITVAAGLGAALGARGGEVSCTEGVDRITLRAASTGGLLAVPAGDPAGPMTVTATEGAGDGNVGDGKAVDGNVGDGKAVDGNVGDGKAVDEACFDLFDWGGGVLTLRSAASGRYVTLKDEGLGLAADQTQPNGWDVHETFRLEPGPDGTELLRNVYSGGYAAVDPVTGLVTVSAGTPAGAERWTRRVVRDGAAEALAAVRAADTAVVVLGNDPHINGRETQDRADLHLPPAQEALLRAVAAECPDTVLVLMSSYPYAVDRAAAQVPAVLWTSHGGQETGRALAAVLLGDSDPAGRLPQTWYRGDDPLPERLDYDIVQAGWTYQYHRAAPAFPFGHGLSYTSFEYAGLTAALDGEEIRCAVEVRNTGARPGTETVQLYTRALGARYQAPLLRLADYRKLRLAPGGSRRVEFTLPRSALAHWDVAEGGFTVDPGAYEILVGRSAGAVELSVPLTVDGPPPGPRQVLGRTVRAVDFDDHAGIALVDAHRDHGDAVAPVAEGAAARLVFRAVELPGGPLAFEAEVAREGAGGAVLELRTGGGRDGGPDGGTLLASLAVPSTGGRYAWTSVRVDLPDSPGGVHDLHLVLRGEQRLASFRVARG
ncbi:glycoside hydrolase family 3 C-terminal domain-containing protein [Kitasatospora sp. NBC_00240]|uniref:glycoside hydrolase family 3 C-terminal domain-containing protein n=1 Tax=Kitasatospora sp. NBC_00240 TaxID=2903567 RepID=UPI002257BB21|nr:glycoside hydrolase family 3 C-terminal domain-containing protein [Kitasatospora sp. NBC_00240]MCX5209907.1 glycoside hydrolase family 3 C-terminal domain-containing protein [Kitasatospora sp. NBC_00240]